MKIYLSKEEVESIKAIKKVVKSRKLGLHSLLSKDIKNLEAVLCKHEARSQKNY